MARIKQLKHQMPSNSRALGHMRIKHYLAAFTPIPEIEMPQQSFFAFANLRASMLRGDLMALDNPTLDRSPDAQVLLLWNHARGGFRLPPVCKLVI